MNNAASHAVEDEPMDLIFLHGRAASGKLTTARALSQLTGLPVFHNHLVVDTLLAVFPFGSEPFVRLREQFWLQVFEEATLSRRSMIFTFAPEPTVPDGFPQRVRTIVETGGGRVHFVSLAVSEAEQDRRIDLASRHEFAKLTDLDTLRSIRAENRRPELPPADLTIDTDTSSAAQSAATIVEFLSAR